MTNLYSFSQYSILETKFNYSNDFIAIVRKLSASADLLVKDVATLLLTKNDFASKKYNKDEYSLDVAEGDTILFNNQPIRLGRFLGQFLPDMEKFKIERFVEVYKVTASAPTDKYTMALYKGAQIIDGYARRNYVAGMQGDMNSSCMNDMTEQIYLYTKNKNIRLAVCLNDEDKICARTLVWTCTDGQNYHDRIYFRDVEQREFLINKLDEQGIESAKGERLQVSLDVLPELYPYVDTFMFISMKGKFLSTNKENCQYILNKTNGRYNEMGAGSESGKEGEYDETAVFNWIEENTDEALELIDNNNTFNGRETSDHVEDVIERLVSDTNFLEDLPDGLLDELESQAHNWTVIARTNKNSGVIHGYVKEALEELEISLDVDTNNLPLHELFDAILHHYKNAESWLKFVIDRAVQIYIEREGVLALVKHLYGYRSVRSDYRFLVRVFEAEYNSYDIAERILWHLTEEDKHSIFYDNNL